MTVIVFIDWEGSPCPMTLRTLRDLLSNRFERRLRRLASSFEISGDSEPGAGAGGRLLVTTLIVRVVVRQSLLAKLRTLLVEIAVALGGVLRSRRRPARISAAADSSAPTARRRGRRHPPAEPRWRHA
jgi:hypothetical protein